MMSYDRRTAAAGKPKPRFKVKDWVQAPSVSYTPGEIRSVAVKGEEIVYGVVFWGAPDFYATSSMQARFKETELAKAKEPKDAKAPPAKFKKGERVLVHGPYDDDESLGTIVSVRFAGSGNWLYGIETEPDGDRVTVVERDLEPAGDRPMVRFKPPAEWKLCHRKAEYIEGNIERMQNADDPDKAKLLLAETIGLCKQLTEMLEDTRAKMR
jgi:hypothetical protein